MIKTFVFCASLCLEPVSKPKQIASIEMWNSCFLIFVGVYTSKYPTEAPALMKYGEIIQDLAARGHNWRYYDQNFRFLRQKQASAFPWGVLHGELWLRAQSPLTRKSQPENVAKPRAQIYQKFPRVFALSITGALLVQAVLLSIHVLNVQGNIGRLSVIFVPPVSPPIIFPSLPSPNLPTPIKVERLISMLSGYNHSTEEFLYSGFSFGFPIHFEGIRVSSAAKNLISASQHPTVVDTKIRKELDSQRLAGPFQFPPLHPFRISPLGVVPKKTPGEFRLIHHLSYPRGSSVNDGIDSEHTRVCYATVDDAIQFMKLAGPGCFLAKTDIKNAFRIIPISPDDYNLLGMQWRGLYYYDRCMPMGCSSSCLTFETFSTSVEWIARKKLNIAHILHLLDDFLIVAASAKLCQDQLDLFLNLCSYLGIPMAPEKTCGPATTLSFAGIELDSICSEARLPLDKIHKSTHLISEFLGRKKVSLREVQSLTGLLNFACSVIKPGKAFLRRLIDLTIGVWSPHHLIRLNKEVKEDLKVWLSFLTEFNGRSFFIDEAWQSSSKLNLYTDTSGALGFGAVFGSKWCYGKWPSDWAHCNVAILEFYPIVLSLYLWGHEMSNQCVLFFTDNEALVHVINKQSCKDKSLMNFVRKLVSICLRHNIFRESTII